MEGTSDGGADTIAGLLAGWRCLLALRTSSSSHLNPMNDRLNIGGSSNGKEKNHNIFVTFNSRTLSVAVASSCRGVRF